LPFIVSFSVAFYRQFGSIDVTFTVGQQYFLLGIIVYSFVQLFLFKPVYLYVLGHEAVHVLATWLCLGKVTSFKVSSAGGSVATSKSNLFISLSPYFVPIYAILLTIFYYIVVHVSILGFMAQKYFMFLFGLTLAFHIVMTVDTLKTRQPDMVRSGYITSIVIIYVLNLIVIGAVLGLFFTSFSFVSFIKNAVHLSIVMYKTIFRQLF